MLVLRLKEAYKIAGQQSKSHQKAKRHYDEHTKLEFFGKGDLVYLYDPVYKRGKAKKFAYKYKGPYEVKQRISPLVYRIRTAEGTDVILQVNRLKRAYGRSLQLQGEPPAAPDKFTGRTRKRHLSKQAASDQIPEETVENICVFDVQGKQIIEESEHDHASDPAQAESSFSSLEPDTEDNTEWTPGSRYLQRKLHNDNIPDLPYQLRSRTAHTREADADADKRIKPDVVTAIPADMSSDTNAEPTITPLKHSYNLRIRTLSH
jgi:hypothetical protein